jgi:hypothetical protein
MALSLGTKLGPYEIVAPPGAGGMGEVYRACDTRLDRTVAIKVLPQHLADDPDSRQRFECKAKVLAALSHPNILTIFDGGSENGVSLVVMQLNLLQAGAGMALLLGLVGVYGVIAYSVSQPNYSHRSTIRGSTRVARRKGIKVASRTAAHSTATETA